MMPASDTAVIDVFTGTNKLSDSLEFFSQNGSRTTRSARQRLLPVVFRQMVRRSLALALGSERLAAILFARKSVDCMAAQLDLVIPEAYISENLHRATILAGGSPSELQSELLKIMLYLASNRMIASSNWDYLSDSRKLISLCRLSGLAEPQNLRALVRLSQGSLTLRAVLDTLFAAAVNTEATDIVSCLLGPESRVRVW